MSDDSYDPAQDGRLSYEAAIGALRMEGVKDGRFLPLPDRPEEIAASHIGKYVLDLAS